MRRETETTIRFDAELLRVEGAAGVSALTTMRLPTSASAPLHCAGNPMIEGVINGFPFRTTLEAGEPAGRVIRLNRALRIAAGVSVGDSVALEITRIGEEPECRVPRDLCHALADAPSAEGLWSKITPRARRDWILWIISAKQSETRRGRIAKACSMLTAGKRRPCCFGGLSWLVKDHPAVGETWLDLPPPAVPRPPAASRPRGGKARSGGG